MEGYVVRLTIAKLKGEDKHQNTYLYVCPLGLDTDINKARVVISIADAELIASKYKEDNRFSKVDISVLRVLKEEVKQFKTTIIGNEQHNEQSENYVNNNEHKENRGFNNE